MRTLTTSQLLLPSLFLYGHSIEVVEESSSIRNRRAICGHLFVYRNEVSSSASSTTTSAVSSRLLDEVLKNSTPNDFLFPLSLLTEDVWCVGTAQDQQDSIDYNTRTVIRLPPRGLTKLAKDGLSTRRLYPQAKLIPRSEDESSENDLIPNLRGRNHHANNDASFWTLVPGSTKTSMTTTEYHLSPDNGINCLQLKENEVIITPCDRSSENLLVFSMNDHLVREFDIELHESFVVRQVQLIGEHDQQM